MMRFLLPAAIAAASASLQAQVNNYGFAVQGGGQFAGRSCNSGSCRVSPVRMNAGTQATFTVFGAPQSFYAIGLSVPSILCQPVRGIGNDLMLSSPVDTLSIGVLNNPVGPSICLAIQETASVNATLPPAAAGLTFRLQALTVGGVGTNVGPVFTESIDLTVI